MFEVLAISDHASALHSFLSHDQVLVPEAIVIVPIVYSLRLPHLVLFCLDIVHFCVGLAVEIGLNGFDFSIYLEVFDVLLFIHDLHALAFPVLLVHGGEDALGCRHLLEVLFVQFVQSLVLVLISAFFVAGHFSQLGIVKLPETNFIHHFLAEFNVQT